MRRLIVLLGLVASSLWGAATPIASYRINAKLDAEKKQVEGNEVLTWVNDSPDPVQELRFHLYMNAFKNTESTFFRESGGQLRGDRSKKDSWGWIDVSKMQIEGGADLTRSIESIHPDDDNDKDRTVIRVPLPSPVPPGATLNLTISFRTQFPHVFARTGYHGNFLLAGQWFPKIGVLEKPGMRYAKQTQWNCHQFHANSEFYANFGTYDVTLTVPSNEVLGATGELVARKEEGSNTTYTFHQENVHDFAWTVQPNFIRVERMFTGRAELSPSEIVEWGERLRLPSQDIALSDVKMIVLLQPEHASQAQRHIRALRNAVKYFGLWYGRYPHKTITLVDPPSGGQGAGGMEYPTFITGGTSWLVSEKERNPEEVIIHEFGHQFWQGQVATNEFEEAWMDEGFNTYSTGKVLDHAYGPSAIPIPVFSLPISWLMKAPTYSSADFDRTAYIFTAKADNLARFAWQYQNSNSYGVNSYMRTGLMLDTLENLLGYDVMARVMRTYQMRYRFGHPAAPDFIRTVNEVSGKDMSWYFDQTIFGSNVVDYRVASVASEMVHVGAGVFGEGDGKKTVSREDAEKAEDKTERDKKQMYLNTVIIRRDGEVVIPVDVRITFANGEIVNQVWDGQYRWVKYKFLKSHKIRSVQVDPDRKLVLDINYSNNSWMAEPEPAAALKLTSNLLFWLQNILLALSSLA